jgi:cation-transporting ATPase 13A3/4/5
VIACGSFQVPLDVSEEQLLQLQREAVEKNFIFHGFLIMSNQMKPDTAGAIEVLSNANIRNIMITGDNALTAINVGKQCGILSADSPVFMSSVNKGKVILTNHS